MNKDIEELTLLILYLTSWEEEGYGRSENGNIEEVKYKNSWKGYPFGILNKLTDEGYLYDGRKTNKSVTLTKKGEMLAEKLKEMYLKK